MLAPVINKKISMPERKRGKQDNGTKLYMKDFTGCMVQNTSGSQTESEDGEMEDIWYDPAGLSKEETSRTKPKHIFIPMTMLCWPPCGNG